MDSISGLRVEHHLYVMVSAPIVVFVFPGIQASILVVAGIFMLLAPCVSFPRQCIPVLVWAP